MQTRHKTSYYVIASVLTASAAVMAAPATAQIDTSAGDPPEMTYEERAIFQSEQTGNPVPAALPAPSQSPEEYAEPVFISQPQIQDIEVRVLEAQEIEYETEEHGLRGPHQTQQSLPPMSHSAERPVHHGAYPGHAMGAPVYFPQDGYPAGAVPYPAGFEREQWSHEQVGRDEWLQECRARYDRDGGRGGQRGQVIGGLLGAAAGGLIGNRISGRGDRLGGTLIGAGVGGLAGAAAGSAIGRSSDSRDVMDECEAYLGQHEAQWRQMRHGYGPVMLVPIMVPVEQRAVVREYVTEEWVEEEVLVHAPAKRVIHRTPAPKPVKTVPVKSVK
jgi:hypothetical protein